MQNKIIECDDDVVAKIPNVMNILYDVFGKEDIKMFAILSDDKLCFLARCENGCVYIDKDNNPIYFSVDEEDNLISVYIEPFQVYFSDNFYLIDENNHEHVLNFYSLPVPDDDGYTGCISYKQYDPQNDVLCELRYQQMYNEGSFNKVYHFHTKVIDAVYIDEKYKNSKNYHVGLLPRRAKYFKSLKFDYEQIGYKLMAINEFGLTRVLHEGAYNLYKERDVLRYIKTRFILPDGSFSDTWPLAKQIHREEIVDLIKQYGFNSEIPKDIIDIYNGENETVKLVKDLIDKVKEVKKELDKPENSRMCLTLSFIDD